MQLISPDVLVAVTLALTELDTDRVELAVRDVVAVCVLEAVEVRESEAEGDEVRDTLRVIVEERDTEAVVDDDARTDGDKERDSVTVRLTEDVRDLEAKLLALTLRDAVSEGDRENDADGLLVRLRVFETDIEAESDDDFVVE